MHDDDRFKLLHGPYAAPPCQIGGRLECEYRGEEVIVGGLTDRLIPWPRVRKTGKASLIVCGDLARAIRTESEQAVAHHWGVSIVTVWKWRVALGVELMNEGTSRLYREYQPEKITEEAYAKMTETMRTDEAREHQRQQKLGKPAPPQTRAGLLRAAKRRKTKLHRERIGESNRKAREGMTREELATEKGLRPWLPKEERLLGTALDRVVAQMIDRSIPAVRARRQYLGIPPSRHSILARTKKPPMNK